MAHILINAVSAKSGGAATYITNLVKRLAVYDTPHHFTVYVPQTILVDVSGLGGKVSTVGTVIGEMSWWRRVYWDQITLRRIVKRMRVDVLVSSSDFGMYGARPKQLLMVRNPLFFSILYRRVYYPLKSLRGKVEFQLRRFLVLLSIKTADLVMTASHSMLVDINESISIPPCKATVNHFGVPRERFLARGVSTTVSTSSRSGRPFRLVYVTEYGDYKNLSTLLKAVRILAEKGMRDIELVLTADPRSMPQVESVTRDEDRRLALDPLVASLVRFTGPVSYDRIPALYADCDALVFPSSVESFGHPLVEAMASGLPIIASDLPICREICDQVAWYFSPFDEEELATKILSLRDDCEAQRKLREAGRQRVEGYFDWPKHVQRFVELVERLAIHG